MTYPWHTTAHKLFTAIILVQWVAAIGIGFYTDTLMLAAIAGTLMAGLPLVMIKAMPNEAITRHVVGIATQLLTALHIHQSFGLIEVHFEIFTILAILSVYRDWRIIASSVLVVAVHHISFFVLQTQGVGAYVFEEGHVLFGILVLHAFFAITEGAALIYITHNAEKEAIAAHALSNSVDRIVGDDKIAIDADITGEGKSIEDFNRLLSALRDLVKIVKSNGEHAKQLSSALSTSSQSIMSMAEENSAEVSRITTTLTEVNDTNHEIANSVETISQLSADATSGTAHAKEIIDSNVSETRSLKIDMDNAVSSIGALSEMCNDIDQTMSSIKAIADQTNLLALNAAIESARAGEHGRGFAVVADEVRQLATKTGENASEISTITEKLVDGANQALNTIAECASRVEKSVEVTNDASESITQINALITELSNNMNLVASSAERQTSKSETISMCATKLTDSSESQAAQIKQNLNELLNLDNDLVKLHQELSKFKA